MKKIKKGFTLFELIIVIIIFSLSLGFIFVNNKLLNSDTDLINFSNIKQKLLDYEYKNSICLKCTKEKACFLYIDEKLQDKKINLNIKDDIEVYKYNSNFSQIYFKEIEPKELERFDVVFELELDKDKKHKDMIVLNDGTLYLYNSIYMNPLKFDSLSDISDYIQDLKQEVKDSAF